MKRGEICWAELWPRTGAEQRGRRPVIVVSHDSFNMVSGWQSVIIVPISTSPAQLRRGPTAVELPAGIGGLKRKSVALCHQVTTLNRQKLDQPVGRLTPEFVALLNSGLRAALDLEDDRTSSREVGYGEGEP